MKVKSKRTVLVTGGFGFIGSHLVEVLLDEPETQVHVVDNLSTSPIDPDEFIANLAHADRLTHDIMFIHDYLAQSDLPEFDEVYHLASVVGPVGVLKHGGEILRSVTRDAYSVAEYCESVGAKLCDVSTSEVYGGGRDGYCSERDSMIIQPKVTIRLEYAIGKLAAEIALTNRARLGSLQPTFVRPFNVAGPRQAPEGGFVLPRFIGQALTGVPLTVYGDGQMVRAFTHVRDIVDGIIRVMRLGKPGTAYNIGNPANKTTILNLAETVVRLAKSSSPITFVDPKKLWGDLFEEANDKYPDADRAQTELGWQPRYGIDETVLQSVEYIQKQIERVPAVSSKAA